MGIAGFYFLILWLVTKDIFHPWSQFVLLQPWISFLIVGFGIQIGLYNLMRHLVKRKTGGQIMAGGSTAMSGASMVSCCAHHLVEVLPLLGLSAAALFLSNYQQELMILGVVTNLIGIGVMVRILSQIKRRAS